MNTISFKPDRAHVRYGFSLIELMIAITIGTLIIGASVYFATSYLESAKKSATKTTMQNLRQLIMLYKNDTGNYPETLQDLKKSGVVKRELPKDGWDRSFVYHVTPDADKPYELYSHGPEGKGGDKALRINVWNLD